MSDTFDYEYDPDDYDTEEDYEDIVVMEVVHETEKALLLDILTMDGYKKYISRGWFPKSMIYVKKAYPDYIIFGRNSRFKCRYISCKEYISKAWGE